MKVLAPVSLILALSLASLPALADALPPNPCDGKAQGDACVDMTNKAGICQPGTTCMPSPCLVCDTSGSSSSSSSGGSTSSSSGGSTSSSSGSASSSSGSASSSSGEPAGETSDSGCALGAGAGARFAIVAAVIGLFGAAAAARRKRR